MKQWKQCQNYFNVNKYKSVTMSCITSLLFRHSRSLSFVLYIFLVFGGGPSERGKINLVEGHGRLIEPPSRSTMWR